MPGTIPPPSGSLQGFWSQIQALAGRITNLEVQQRTPRIARGIATLSFSGSPDSSGVVVTHGLSGVPAAVVATAWNATTFGQIPFCNVFAVNDTTFTLSGQTTASWTGTVTVAWIASL